jgi:hypothetical protein
MAESGAWPEQVQYALRAKANGDERRDWSKLTNQRGNRSVPLPASKPVGSFAHSFQVPTRRRPTGIRPTADLAESFSFRDVDGFCGPHQLTAGRTENTIIGRAEAGQPPDHHRFHNAERRAILVRTLCTKIHNSS